MDQTILIVDDQFGIRALLSELFNTEGYTTLSAANGVEALQIIAQQVPDLVLLDMKIPGMDGLEILQRIREVQPDQKVVMMTAYGELNMIDKAVELGIIGHFIKPFDIEELRNSVNSWLSMTTTA
ncbi:response regulator [Rubeoparvulum massiliense]|uniref:response regulator n=1 Tax=Rubeoparvulum massiliense TaxID=1631346 RepID=UPI00065DD255|nr:response regulator [Rubeoparvulum massiliense]